MHILAGKLKSRKIHVPKHLKAVEARIKGVLYNLFGRELPGKEVLDLFAGAGSLGIEALSWGAARAVFVDINKSCVKVIKNNLSSLGLLKQSQVYLKDAGSAVKDFHLKKMKFGFIFLDPPYYKGLLIKTLKTLEACDIVERSGFIVSLGWRKEFLENKGFSCVFKREYGDRRVEIFTPLDR